MWRMNFSAQVGLGLFFKVTLLQSQWALRHKLVHLLIVILTIVFKENHFRNVVTVISILITVTI